MPGLHKSISRKPMEGLKRKAKDIIYYCIFKNFCYNKYDFGVWRSLVARSAGGREVAGSNPVAPIGKSLA